MDGHASSSPPARGSPAHDDNAAANHASPSDSSQDDAQDRSPQPQPKDSTSEAPAAERHPKGKRKRTAAKDKAILEAAYHANPKPDKMARLELVERVSLNEKEVQIWFQNRRQNDRRKSRPLSPQEIAALRYGGMQILSSDPIPYNPPVAAVGALDASPTQPLPQSLPEARFASPSTSDPGPTASSDDAERRAGSMRDSGTQTVPVVSPASSQGRAPPEDESSDDPTRLSRSFSSSVGYLSNRWNSGGSFSTPSTLGRNPDDSLRLEPFPPSSYPSTTSSASVLPPPSSQSSQFRLSLSLEGKAEVVTSITSPPHLSLPRPGPENLSLIPPVRQPAGLQRSNSSSSAQSPITLPPISALTSSVPASGPRPLPPRLTRGRSRDVHAWEFCCDADNQEDPLVTQAKHESSGSAIAVISLLRSTSSSSGPLTPSSSAKRNAPVKSASRSGVVKKRRLSRTLSSVARLQTSADSNKDRAATAAPRPEKGALVGTTGGDGKGAAFFMSPQGSDSDKENWSPDEEGNPPAQHRRPRQPANPANGGGRSLLSGTAAPSATAQQQQQSKPRRAMGRGTLLERRNSPFLSADHRANTAPAPGRRVAGGKGHSASPLEIFEDDGDGPRRPAPGVADDEVERFMRGEVSPSKKGDVDAVAGLLSLSQGNWR